jgi:hypothetical protein
MNSRRRFAALILTVERKGPTMLAHRRHAWIEPRLRPRVYFIRQGASLGAEKAEEGRMTVCSEGVDSVREMYRSV